MPSIAQEKLQKPLRNYSDLRGIVWPNGEIAIHRQRKFRPKPLSALPYVSESLRIITAAIANNGLTDVLALARSPGGRVLMGLSPLANSDRMPKPIARKGLKGITALGRRRVRNAAYLLQKRYGRYRLSFTTVTLPELCGEDMDRLHQGWHKAIELYRLNIRRYLEAAGLPTGIVGVSEVQEERHERTGLPVLHGHFVFVGGWGYGQWAISPEMHDLAWQKAINAVLGKETKLHAASCKIQPIKTSAEAYLGKYMSKGAKNVERIRQQGFEAWLPKQWWNCSKSLLLWMEKEKTIMVNGCGFFLEAADKGVTEIWAWHRTVVVDYKDGCSIAVCEYGKLTELGKQLAKET